MTEVIPPPCPDAVAGLLMPQLDVYGVVTNVLEENDWVMLAADLGQNESVQRSFSRISACIRQTGALPGVGKQASPKLQNVLLWSGRFRAVADSSGHPWIFPADLGYVPDVEDLLRVRRSVREAKEAQRQAERAARNAARDNLLAGGLQPHDPAQWGTDSPRDKPWRPWWALRSICCGSRPDPPMLTPGEAGPNGDAEFLRRRFFP